ncbi:UNVERIFIED_CONTAM: hypothetical protein NCL1_38266 [Trichonephila clavipes]
MEYQSNNGLLNTINYVDKKENQKISSVLLKHGVTINRENVNNNLLFQGLVNILKGLLELEAAPNSTLDNGITNSMLRNGSREIQQSTIN